MKRTQAGSRRSREIKVDVRLRVLTLESDVPAASCPDCDQPLNLHQPDEGMPAQLLATCETCSLWFAIHEHPTSERGLVMFEIAARQVVAALRAKLAED